MLAMPVGRKRLAVVDAARSGKILYSAGMSDITGRLLDIAIGTSELIHCRKMRQHTLADWSRLLKASRFDAREQVLCCPDLLAKLLPIEAQCSKLQAHAALLFGVSKQWQKALRSLDALWSVLCWASATRRVRTLFGGHIGRPKLTTGAGATAAVLQAGSFD
jgi:hypothetical protein